MAKRASTPSEAGDETIKDTLETERVAAEPSGDEGAPAPAQAEAAQAVAQDGTVEPESAEQQMQAQIEALQAKADDHWDRLLRTQAEMENLRKRSQRDIENAHKFALEGFAGELLGVNTRQELAAASQTLFERLTVAGYSASFYVGKCLAPIGLRAADLRDADIRIGQTRPRGREAEALAELHSTDDTTRIGENYFLQVGQEDGPAGHLQAPILHYNYGSWRIRALADSCIG